MRPTSIEDLTAIVALYRPGPMDSIPTFIANKLDPSKVFKSKNKTIIPKKKGPVQPAGGQKGPSGSASTSKSSSGSGNPVRK